MTDIGLTEDDGRPPDDLRYRLATVSDAEAVAVLHADSWRRHYRGAYSDAFLDGGVGADRLADQNLDARAFYEARGGRCVERVPVPSPGGQASRLTGSPVGLRYAWPDPRRLDIRGGEDVEA